MPVFGEILRLAVSDFLWHMITDSVDMTSTIKHSRQSRKCSNPVGYPLMHLQDLKKKGSPEKTQEIISMKLVNFRNDVAQIVGLLSPIFFKDAATKAVDFSRLSLEAVREDLDRQCEDQAGKIVGVDIFYRENFDVISWNLYGKG